MGCNWRKIIFDKYNLEAFAYNDLHCAAMGEYNFGLEEKPSNFICLGIGTGINIGIIINGEVFYGDSSLSCYLDNCTDLDDVSVWFADFNYLQTNDTVLGQ